ncbi:type VI secretion system Vgr family protein [Paraburkholderia sacchari]|uniref:type VI secretion system Vgr family protein n=1 Tax=Paraburkholderia sacchari TaxID=159450 RepID=UPI001BD0CC4D|nr:type VI secretion system tip protein TssI/VgrG [Paraburkholderia sacchari]
MALVTDKLLANRRFEFGSAARKKDSTAYDFAVVEMEGFEALSQPFRFTLTLVSDDSSVDFDAMLANPATFTIYGPQGDTSTPYHGVLAEFEQLHNADGYAFYRAVLVPRAWNLSLYRLSEVYLEEQPIPDTLAIVLKNAQLTNRDFEFRLMGTYRARSFICQYEETYLDFVSRWMEHEGIYYYFDHRGGADRLIAVDNVQMHEKTSVGEDDERKVVPIVYRPDDRMDTGMSGDTVRQFVSQQKPLPRDVILQEFNHRKAALQLKASAVVSENGRGQAVLYGEDFRSEDEGRRYAKLRAEEILCGGRVYSGEGSAVGLRAGYFATLSGHYRDDFNGEYLITEIHHEGSQAGALLSGARASHGDGGTGGETSYRNSFRAIGSKVQFRAPRTTPKPRVAGTMNAIVDGEGSGQYAELDEYGQYKVQLPFDLTPKNPNKASARVRMATPYAGSDHGMHFPLLKGAEVLLSFTDGDPDRPVIVGAVPNSENHSVVNVQNAHINRIATAGGNQLHMDDSKGKEVMFLHSPFHNSTIGIGSIDPKGGGSILSMTAGANETMTVGRTNSISLGMSNSITGGYKFNIDASIGGSMSLGYSTSMAYSRSVSWKDGASVSIDDSAGLSVKPANSILASGDVTLMGGQSDAVETEIKALKTVAKAAVLANAAVQVAAGVSAGVALSVMENQEGDDAWNSLDNASKLKVAQSGGESAAKAKAMSVNDDAGTATNAESSDYNTDKATITTYTNPINYTTTTAKDALSADLKAKYEAIRSARLNGEQAAVAAYKANASAGDKVGAPSGSQWGPTGPKGMGLQGGLSALGALSGITATEVVNALASSLEEKYGKGKKEQFGSQMTLGRNGIRMEAADLPLLPTQPRDPNKNSYIELKKSAGVEVGTQGDLQMTAKKTVNLRADESLQVSAGGTLALTSSAESSVAGTAVTLLAGADMIKVGGGSASVLSSSVQIGPPGVPATLISQNAKTVDTLTNQVAAKNAEISAQQAFKISPEQIARWHPKSTLYLMMTAKNAELDIKIAALEGELAALEGQLLAATTERDSLAANAISIVQGLSITQSDARLWAGTSSIKLSATGIVMGFGDTEYKLDPTGASANGTLIKLG